MDAQQFLAEFGHIANAQGGISNLRRMVSSLAVQGKLSQFSDSDTPVKNTLDSLERRRQEVLKEQSLTSTKKHRNLGEPKTGFTVPAHWGWEFLAYVSSWPLKDGDWVESKDQNPNGGVRLIQLADIGVGEYKNKSARFLTESRAEELNCYFLNPGDVLIARLPDPLGRACIFPDDPKQCVTVVDVAVCRAEKEFINPHYLVHCVNSTEIQRQIEELATGTTRKRVATGKLGALSLPIPPLEEQTRIVAKVDELVALCDLLEALQQKRRALQNQLRQSTLQAVAASQSPFELQKNWQRLQANFDQLFSAPEDVQMLRDTVIDLGLRGLLLAGLDYDDSIVTDFNEAPPLPREWHWSTLAELSDYITSGSRGWKRYITSTGDSFIRSQDIRHDELRFENPAFVLLPEKTEGMRTLVKPGDLLLTITGGNVGKCAVVPQLEQDAYVSQHVALIRLRDPNLAELLHFWMINSFGGRQFLAQYIYGDKPGLNLKQVGSVIAPVPPFSDCERVLSSLRAYQKACEELEQKLKLKHELATTLAAASVSALTGIAIEQEEEPMKAPQTELVAPVRLGTPPDVKAQAPLATLLARHNGEMSAKDLWQRFGGEIDAFYAQLKTEVAHSWLLEPTPAEMREKAES